MYKKLEWCLIAALAGCLIYSVFSETESEAVAHEEPITEEVAVVEESPLDRIDLMEHMIQACISGDMELGRVCAELRNAKIDEMSLDEPHIDFDELHLLARVIWFEAGSDWLSQEWRIKVGEVLMNRVASPEFPNTLEECVYQKRQYQMANTEEFRSMKAVSEKCVRAAAQLLSGHRIINDPTVVYQANHRLGGGVYEKMYDEYLGTTYLCYTDMPSLYEGEKDAD